MAQGWGNGAIAERLSLSPKTVRNNVSLILGKLHSVDGRRPPELSSRGTRTKSGWTASDTSRERPGLDELGCPRRSD